MEAIAFFVTASKIYQFRAKRFEIKKYPLRLGNNGLMNRSDFIGPLQQRSRFDQVFQKFENKIFNYLP